MGGLVFQTDEGGPFPLPPAALEHGRALAC
jgi:hypothetical protein